MSATAIILLIGVCSFMVTVGIMVVMLSRFRKTLEALEQTLGNINTELGTLSPVLEGAMQQLELTGREVGKTASEVKTLVHGVNSHALTPVAAGVVNYIPLALGVFRVVKTVFARKGGRDE
jgi:fructose-specific phosphotransferase system IIC component